MIEEKKEELVGFEAHRCSGHFVVGHGELYISELSIRAHFGDVGLLLLLTEEEPVVETDQVVSPWPFKKPKAWQDFVRSWMHRVIQRRTGCLKE